MIYIKILLKYYSKLIIHRNDREQNIQSKSKSSCTL